MKRLFLAQGELSQVYDGEPGIRYLAYIELVKDAIRGNHFHKRKSEVIYVIRGRILLIVQDLSTRDTACFDVDSGDMVFIPVNTAHCFRTVEPGHGIEFSVQSFDAADIFPHSLSFEEFGRKQG